MSKTNKRQTSGADTAASRRAPAARDEDPFDNADVTSILDDAWADLH